MEELDKNWIKLQDAYEADTTSRIHAREEMNSKISSINFPLNEGDIETMILSENDNIVPSSWSHKDRPMVTQEPTNGIPSWKY